jgi:4-aminobutyrate aminotransferase-like enzyme/Ser/Thr protein kinase RdoA (MazF antagonist)
MSLLQQAPRFDAAAAAELAREIYRIDADATPLTSERDQNFLLTTGDGTRFVLKIANAAEERALLEAQNGILQHLEPLALCPRVVPAGDGSSIVEGPMGHLVRLLTWLPGQPLATLSEQPDGLLEDLGRRLGEMDRALADFDHPALHRDFHWDLARGFEVVEEHGPAIRDRALRGLVHRVTLRVAGRDERALRRVRRSIIHGDANDYNILVDVSAPRVAGLIDFGDSIHAYTVADLAIAVAYAVLGKDDPLQTAVTILRGYHGSYPLTEDEASVLFGLVQLRLCVSVSMAAYQQPLRPDDEYLGVSQAPVQQTLPKLAAIHPDAAEEAFRSTCAFQPLFEPSTIPKQTTASRRRLFVGRSVRVGYTDPVKVSRGWMQYLFDETGRRYLDAYNNVPHVGHSHPRVVRAAADALRTLNTNTRYLYDTLWQFAERLTETLPEPLRVCYFVNSGSEANELALRLARAHTQQRDVIVLDAAYHGNTTVLTDISPYKFNGPGGEGPHPWVHIAPLPDDYRGRYKRNDPEAGPRYAEELAGLVAELRRRYVGLSAFIAETCPSVGGQIILPPGYLAAAYRVVRDDGGLCIADEVQTAYGRMGTTFYAFQEHNVVPDIVVLGKPIGNGYPLGAVVTTREIAGSFDNGMEFFSTFGGSSVSCAVGLAVLDVVAEERLQPHALRVGDRLLKELRALQARHQIIGDVRGSGFFFGVELVQDRSSIEPAIDAASFVVNHMRENGVLIGTDGPHHNVLKIRPPMPFDDGDVDTLISALDAALSHGQV